MRRSLTRRIHEGRAPERRSLSAKQTAEPGCTHAANTIYRCQSCNRCFSGRRFALYAATKLNPDKIVGVLHSLCEGCSIRATERLLGVHRDTVSTMLVKAADSCQNILDRYVRNIRPRFIQLDELWTFVFKKEKRIRDGDPTEWGDAYTWFALDPDTKLIVSHLVAKRDGPSALEFVTDLSHRLAGRVQITSDAFKPYIGAIEESFGADVDFAQLIKVYGKSDNSGLDWYGPGKVIEVVPNPISGNPDPDHVCISHVERVNLSVRTQLHRLTRLALGFSKKVENLRAAVTVYTTFYNFCRVHRTLRVTPAMEAGLTNHVWGIEELLASA